MAGGGVSGLDEVRLEAWLRAALPGHAPGFTLAPVAGGQSNPTYFLTLGASGWFCASSRRESFCPLLTRSTGNTA